MSTIVLGYWNIRGYAQPIRLLLAAAGIEFEDRMHAVGPAPSFSKADWFALKPNLPLDFPNLPYLYDGEVKLSQSVAILRYLGRKTGLSPKSETEQQRADLVEQQLIDWRSAGSNVFYNPNFDSLIQDYKDGLADKMRLLSNFLGNKNYLAGDNLTYVDFLAYEWLDVHKILVPNLLSGFDNLEKLISKIENIENLSRYMKSDKFMKWPLNNDQAKWGQRSMAPPN